MEIEIFETPYELTNEPSHGVVRKLNSKKQNILVNLLMNNPDLLEELTDKFGTENLPVNQVIAEIRNTKPEEFFDFISQLEEFEEISTISLATNHIFEINEFDGIKESEYQVIFNACKETLNGTGKDFLSK